MLEYLHAGGFVEWEVPKWLSLGLIVVIFVIALVMARMEGPVEADALDEKAQEILADEDPTIPQSTPPVDLPAGPKKGT
ncbi:hypothetical protein D3C83_12230 [compost metagenome]